MGVPWKSHVMEERHGGKMVSILALRKNFHMGGAMGAPCHRRVPWGENGFHYNVEENFHMGGAMGEPCHGRAPWGGIGFHSNVEEKLPHGGRHWSAMSWKLHGRKNLVLFYIKEKLPHGGAPWWGAMGETCYRRASWGKIVSILTLRKNFQMGEPYGSVTSWAWQAP